MVAMERSGLKRHWRDEESGSSRLMFRRESQNKMIQTCAEKVRRLNQ